MGKLCDRKCNFPGVSCHKICTVLPRPLSLVSVSLVPHPKTCYGHVGRREANEKNGETIFYFCKALKIYLIFTEKVKVS